MHTQCSGCRRAVQKVCQTCNALTRKQFHDKCERGKTIQMQNGLVLETAVRQKTRKPYSLRSIFICAGIAGFFILGFSTAAYLDLFQDSVPGSDEVTVANTPMAHAEPSLAPHNVLQNCLAYGSGESVTVTCPTQYGYVYKAILDMPSDLAGKFSGAVFSIRGVSLVENSDATVVLQYQGGSYMTSFFGS